MFILLLSHPYSLMTYLNSILFSDGSPGLDPTENVYEGDKGVDGAHHAASDSGVFHVHAKGNAGHKAHHSH